MYNPNKKHILFIVIILAFIIYIFPQSNHSLTWTSINVSNTIQGDAHIIIKDNKTFMIDTGSWQESKTYLLPYLQKNNIKHIHAVLITHPHFDHYGGLVMLLENNITIDSIYMNFPTKKQMQKEWWGGEYKHLLYIKESAKKYKTKFSSIKMGEKLIFDDESYIDILYVYDGINTPVGTTDINDMSVITMLHDGNNRFLLTGDLNNKLGTYLANNAGNIKADILKVPHHGVEGLAPNNFFEKVSPTYLIVPTTKELWCSQRALRVRSLAKTKNYITYINGFHGDITVTSYQNTFTVNTSKKTNDICPSKF